jgi:PilZ domain
MTKSYTAERAEDRLEVKVAAMLVGRHGKLDIEKAVTENASVHGVRVISSSEWYPNDMILVSVPAAHFTAAARVAYCDALGDNRFSIGLEFASENDVLELAALQAAAEIPAV